MIESPVLTKVRINFKGFTAYDVEPPVLPDVLSDRPVIVFGKWKGQPAGTITVTGVSGSGKFSESINVSTVKPSKENLALRYLWARHRIMLLSDYNKLSSNVKRVKEITDLGLAYNLLTAYTSFVAVDNIVRKTGDSTTVNQPLPMPEGVSDYAVGGGMVKTMALAPPSPGMYPHYAGKRMETAMQEKPREAVKTKDSAAPKATLANVIATGGITKQSAEAVINKSLASIAACLSGITESYTYGIRLTVAVFSL